MRVIRGLEAFTHLNESIGTETEPLRLAGWSVGHYEWHGSLWCALLSDVPNLKLRVLLFARLPDPSSG